MKIWEEKAEIQLPEGFEEATVGEKRKTYGMGKKLPDKMYIVRDKHVIIRLHLLRISMTEDFESFIRNSRMVEQ